MSGDTERERPFVPEVLDRTVIAVPLLRQLAAERAGTAPPKVHPVVIEVNLDHPKGRAGARGQVIALVDQALERSADAAAELDDERPQGVDEAKGSVSEQYVFAALARPAIEELVRLDNPGAAPANPAGGTGQTPRSIFRIWPDFKVHPLTTKSIATVKADAAGLAFSADGHDIVWAVIDSGIAGDHPHFAAHRTLELPDGLEHRDFTGKDAPLEDPFGHGTHVGGIIAGGQRRADGAAEIRAGSWHRDEHGDRACQTVSLEAISGMAPRTRLLSLKVLDDGGDGLVSNIIAALQYVQELNAYGRRLQVHGVNLSVGYDFEPEWFACGHSPLCVEVDALVRSGVVVVAAAGNTGYGWHQSAFRGAVAAGMDLTINDPGNAELAITVGSTHRDAPHVYGVSYFSSKGPTGDGRRKPDLVAPGEKIVSCATGALLERAGDPTIGYVEDSGTSMAAPHVSGTIAAFLSVRREFIGRPDRVKEIFTSTATDLRRDPHFQGHGLVDLMRAIQSV